MDDQGASSDSLYVCISQNVTVEINLQKRGGCHLTKHPVGALDQHMVRFARYPKSEVIVGHVVDAIIRQNSIPSREFNTSAPFLGADLLPHRFSGGYKRNGHRLSLPERPFASSYLADAALAIVKGNRSRHRASGCSHHRPIPCRERQRQIPYRLRTAM